MFKKVIVSVGMSLMISTILSSVLLMLMLKPVIIPLMIWAGVASTYVPFFETKSIEDFITSNASFIGLFVSVVGLYIFINSIYKFYKFISIGNHQGVQKYVESNTFKAFTIPINLIFWNTLFYFGLVSAIKPMLVYVVLLINSAYVGISSISGNKIEANTLVSINMFLLFALISGYFILVFLINKKIISPFLDKINLFIAQRTVKYEPEKDMVALLERVNKHFEGRRISHATMPATWDMPYLETTIRIPASLGNYAKFTIEYASFAEFKDLFESNVRIQANLFTRETTRQMLGESARVSIPQRN